MNWLVELCVAIVVTIPPFMLWRNNRVYNLRMRLLYEESALWKDMIEANVAPWDIKYRRIDALPSYQTMFYKFWIKPEAWEVPLAVFYLEEMKRLHAAKN